MCICLRSDDRIDRARRQALGATDAGLLVDLRDERRPLDAVLRIERQGGAAEEGGERGDRGRAPRRALVDLRLTGGDGARVGRAARVAAARALGLRQQGVDVVRGLTCLSASRAVSS